MSLEQIEEHTSFGGVQAVFRHVSEATGCPMTFAVFLPPQAKDGPCPSVLYLSGLTCSHLNVMEKGEYRREAAALGLIVVAPDTSPRGPGVPDDVAYDLGQGAGFYVDATQSPWAAHYQMERYIVHELQGLLLDHFPMAPERRGIFGHSMGGMGAIALALRHPGVWASVSAFAPIAAPSQTPWGDKAFSAYLGPDRDLWARYDPVSLIRAGRRAPPLLVDVGEADPFLERELRPDVLEEACRQASQPLQLRRHPGYDHSYFFISTFMDDHLRWHAHQVAEDFGR